MFKRTNTSPTDSYVNRLYSIIFIIESQPTAPEQPHPPEMCIETPVSPPAAPQERPNLRSPRTEIKPPKFFLSEESIHSSSESGS